MISAGSGFSILSFSVSARRVVSFVALLGLWLGSLPVMADSVAPAEPAWLPVKPFSWDNSKKEELAQSMRDWTVGSLQERGAKLGLVARQGAYVTRLFDRTGMTHSAFVFQHPETDEWITYSLY